MNENIVTFDAILNFKKERKINGESLLSIIMSYCEEYDLDPMEVGEQLAEDKRFKKLFKEDLTHRREAYFEGESLKESNEWFCD